MAIAVISAPPKIASFRRVLRIVITTTMTSTASVSIPARERVAIIDASKNARQTSATLRSHRAPAGPSAQVSRDVERDREEDKHFEHVAAKRFDPEPKHV